MNDEAFVVDREAKQTTFEERTPGVCAYATAGDPDSGVIVGDEGVMVIEAQATPIPVQGLIPQIGQVTDQPIRFLGLRPYHAVGVSGTSAYGTARFTTQMDGERGAGRPLAQAYAAAEDYPVPRIWTAQRDPALGHALQASVAGQ